MSITYTTIDKKCNFTLNRHSKIMNRTKLIKYIQSNKILKNYFSESDFNKIKLYINKNISDPVDINSLDKHIRRIVNLFVSNPIKRRLYTKIIKLNIQKIYKKK